MPAPPTTRIVVVGAGAFGRNHLRVWQELEQSGAPVHLSAIVERDPVLAATLAVEFSLPFYHSVSELLASQPLPAAASVAVPTSLHFVIAAQLLTAGVDVLLEKPMTTTLEQADELIALAERNGRILQVGHLERFNPAVVAARAHLTRPMFFEAHRLSIFTARSLDVDVVLDLMIHDLDLVLSMVPSEVREVRAVGLPVLSRTSDIANVRVEFENGCIANFTASRISTERVRKLRLFQPHQYLSLDFARQDLLLIDVTAAAGLSPEQLAELIERNSKPEEPGAPQHPTAGLSLTRIPVEPGEPLRRELEAFVDCVRSRRQPEVDGHEGRRALALGLAIVVAIEQHMERTGLS